MVRIPDVPCSWPIRIAGRDAPACEIATRSPANRSTDADEPTTALDVTVQAQIQPPARALDTLGLRRFITHDPVSWRSSSTASL
jgi:hypothetical protein